MYVIILFILILTSFLYLKFAEKFKIIDKPNQRSSHKLPTIRGGGIIFLFGFCIYHFKLNFEELYFFFAVLIIGAISFVDDLITISARVRLPFQIIAVSLVVYEIDGFSLSLWVPLITIFLCTAFINFFNFMDGINGIMGMYSGVVLIGMYLVNMEIELLNDELIIIELLALIVFGFFNFRKKARFFAGDVGSVSMALIFVYMTMLLIYKSESPIFILLLIVYITDATLTLLYRLLINENITIAHRQHVYQKLVDKTNLSHLQVSGMYSVLQFLIIGLIILVLPYSTTIHYYVTGVVIFVMVVLYFLVFQKLKTNIKINMP